jgi:hypothetical protein
VLDSRGQLLRAALGFGAALGFATCSMPSYHLLHDRHGTLADERDRHRMGAHAVARDAAGGMGGVEEGRSTVRAL